MADPRITKLAHLLVDYSSHVQPKDQVAILGSPASTPLVAAVYERVLERGAYPNVVMTFPGQNEIFFRVANDDQLTYISPMQDAIFNTFDAYINTGGTTNTRELSGIDPKRQALWQKGREPIMKVYMERGAAGTFKWCGTSYPTEALAQEAEMSLRNYEDFVYTACHVASDDDPVAYWQQFSAMQAKLINYLKGKHNVEVRGPNVEMTLSITDRTFINADGKHNMPDGEIFTGPVEDSVNGWVRFTYPAVVQGRVVEGVELTFENGRVVTATAKKNEDFLLRMLDTDPGARYLGEWAIGTNMDIQQFTKSILFDEKIGGTIHMAVGRGYPETGSKNVSAIHWDMICDMKDGGEIFVDGELFYRSGQFMVL